MSSGSILAQYALSFFAQAMDDPLTLSKLMPPYHDQLGSTQDTRKSLGRATLGQGPVRRFNCTNVPKTPIKHSFCVHFVLSIVIHSKQCIPLWNLVVLT